MSLILSTSTHILKLYLTDMLFNSPRLRFSEQQKKAVLNWALQLGACNVPSLYALSQCQEHVKKVVGNSATAVTTGTGHRLYMQDIPFLIAKVQHFSSCLEPLCLMQQGHTGLCQPYHSFSNVGLPH
jgi:hypothetical protein